LRPKVKGEYRQWHKYILSFVYFDIFIHEQLEFANFAPVSVVPLYREFYNKMLALTGWDWW